VTASRLLPNSRLLSYAGWGHTAYFSAGSSCVDTAVTRYLVSGQLPPAHTVCPAVTSPFKAAQAAAGAAAAGAVALQATTVPLAVRLALHAH
jgi:hypothetical protein